MNQPALLDLMIPPELLLPLSKAASERGVSMQVIVLELVEEWARELEASRKVKRKPKIPATPAVHPCHAIPTKSREPRCGIIEFG